MTTKKATAKKHVAKPATAKKSTAKKASSKPASTPSSKVDEQLASYRSMRDFKITDEPSGKTTKSSDAKQHPFVVQKHAASHLHYDFRLGWNGVLRSWAVAKGPSYNVKDRRLAVQVEDHPMEYGGFEGIIPKGQYGGGTVMLWDQGTWEPQPGQDVDEGLRNGSLKFILRGKKLLGKWTLVRMHTAPGDKSSRWGSSSKPNWLLIKEHDDFERGPESPAITDEKPDSVVTGRTMEAIAAQEDHVWNSKDTAGDGQAWYRQATQEKSVPPKTKATRQPSPTKSPARTARPSMLQDLPREEQPKFLSPQLAQEAIAPPEGAEWLHELKLDGYRIQARKSGASVTLLTRKGLDWTHRMRPIVDALAQLPAEQATLDGEVCVVGADGTTSFADLQAWFQSATPAPLTYFAFDLLHLDGGNTRHLPLLERRSLLTDLLSNVVSETLLLSDHITGSGERFYQSACEHHAEGIVSKLASSPYTGTRSTTWLKSKCLHEQEFVIGGYTDSSEGPERIGSLLLGVYENKQLLYAGRTGTGFTKKLKRSLYQQLHSTEQKQFPFAKRPSDARSDVHWVTPKFVAQVRFATWTADNLVRQAAFLGLREDKSPEEVHREQPTVSPIPKRARKSAQQTETTATPARGRTKASLATVQPRAAKLNQAKPQAPPPNPLPIRLTHPEKIIDPQSQLTKSQLADFYWAIADRMLPYVADRPLSLVRCPDGAGKPCFFQKHTNHMLPPGIGSVMVKDKKTGKLDPYITLNTREALAGLAQMGVLEVHPWSSSNSDLEHPNRLILDLDPDESLPWSALTAAATDVRARLKKLGLISFLKSTGGKGLHIVAPIQPTITFAEVKEAAHRIVLAMEHDSPKLYLTRMTKAARVGKIYLDYLRNERGATAVAPFSPRARLGVPVSLPLPWSALQLSERPIFSVSDFEQWRPKLSSDPWKLMASTRQSLDLSQLKSLSNSG
ncbi:MAG: DNA ligase D [Acidobacteriaceae bacterium]|nr:DNA ligase D [Acidobacteriaceae bacterium]